MLINEIQPDQIIVSPINVGSGHVHCAHGVLPVPAPATANILKNVPIYSGRIRDELCTPTGAALLKHFANFFGNMPVMRTEAIGCGMGKKDFDTANCVRAFIGEAEKEEETVVQLSCNLDDITPEEIAFASERFFEAGALDVYTVPAEMKKSRPGILLQCYLRSVRPQSYDRTYFQVHNNTWNPRKRKKTLHAVKRDKKYYDSLWRNQTKSFHWIRYGKKKI